MRVCTRAVHESSHTRHLLANSENGLFGAWAGAPYCPCPCRWFPVLEKAWGAKK